MKVSVNAGFGFANTKKTLVETQGNKRAQLAVAQVKESTTLVLEEKTSRTRQVDQRKPQAVFGFANTKSTAATSNGRRVSVQ